MFEWRQTPVCLPVSPGESIRIWAGWQTTTGENGEVEKTGVRGLIARCGLMASRSALAVGLDLARVPEYRLDAVRLGRHGAFRRTAKSNPSKSRKPPWSSGCLSPNLRRPSPSATAGSAGSYKPFQLRIPHFLGPVTTSFTTSVLPGISSRHLSC